MTQILFYMAKVISGHLWVVSWQTAILVLFVLLVGRLFQNAPTVFRYWLWMIVLVRLCIPVGFSLPGVLEQLLGNQIESSRFAAPIRQVTETVGKTERISNPDVSQSDAALFSEETTRRLTVAEISGLLWIGIASFLAVLILWRAYVVSRRLKASPAITRPDLIHCFLSLKDDLGIRTGVSLRYLDLQNTDVPAVIGIRAPKVLLPRHIADDWEIDDIRPLLLHELAHVKRGDLFLNWLQVIVQAVYFFHPLVWYVNSHIRQLREELSDDLAVHHLEAGKKRYLTSILRVMESVVKEPVFGFVGIGFSERKHSLGWRIERMMKKGYEGYHRLSSKMVSGIIIVIAIGVVVSLLPTACLFDSNDEKADEPGVVVQDDVNINSESKTNEVINYSELREKNGMDLFVLGIADGEAFDPVGEVLIGVENLVETVKRFSEVEIISSQSVDLDSQLLDTIPVLFVSAKGDFSLSNSEAQNLRSYFLNGGFAIFDNPEPETLNGESEQSLKKIFRDALGDNVVFHPIPNEHMLNHVFFDFDDGPPSGADRKYAIETGNSELYRPYLEGLWIDGRLVAVYSGKGYIYSWTENPQGIHAKYGLNMVLFGTLQKGGMLHQLSQ